MNLERWIRALTMGVVVVGLGWPSAAVAQTTISGGSVANQTWTAANSPYIIKGDITVPSGATLTIEEGVELQIEFGDQMQSGDDVGRVEVIVEGEIDVNGTETNPVRMLPDISTTVHGHWYGIRIEPTATGAEFDHIELGNAVEGIVSKVPGSVVFVRNSKLHTNWHQSVRVDDGTVTLESVEVYGNSSYGVRLMGSPAVAKVNGSQLYENGTGGVFANMGSELDMSNTIVRDNTNEGVFVEMESDSAIVHDIVNCTIDNNGASGIIIYAPSSSTTSSINVLNTLVTNNAALGINQYPSSANVSVTYSNAWNNGSGNYGGGVSAGTHTISTNPLYVSPPADLSLQATSPCIDAGTSTGAPTQDILGNPRPLDGNGVNGPEHDMGAYEHDAVVACGDGTVTADEACDDGQNNGTYGNCNSNCTGPGEHCGDNEVQSDHEECDDGNTDDGDGCSAVCTTESVADAGSDADTPNVDAGADSGAEVGTDIDVGTDADVGADATQTGDDRQNSAGEGCGCSSTQDSPSPAAGVFLMLVALGLAVTRRRRERG